MAVSSFNRNTGLVTSLRRHLSQLQHFIVDLKRGSKPMNFSRSIVHLPRNRIQVILGESRQVGALWEVLTEKPVGVLIRTSLPGAVRVCKEHRNPRPL